MSFCHQIHNTAINEMMKKKRNGKNICENEPNGRGRRDRPGYHRINRTANSKQQI